MTIISSTYIGDLGDELSRALHVLNSVGINTDDFMKDMLGTLRYEMDFMNDLNTFIEDLLYGTYYHHKLSYGNTKQFAEYTSRFMEDTARLSVGITKHIHAVLVNKDLYDKHGKFPHEFYLHAGKTIYFRSL